jgi:hypothetical protein
MVQAPDRERSSEVLGELEKCMPALVDENAVRQQHKASKKNLKKGLSGGVAGVNQLSAALKAQGLEYFRSCPVSGDADITPDAPVNSEQRWLLVGDAGLSLLTRMQPGSDLERHEICMDDMGSKLSDPKWHCTVGTVWERSKRKLWVLYVCYKRGCRPIDYQQVWRDLCDAYGSPLLINCFQGDAAPSHWMALQRECPFNGKYGNADFYKVFTVHAGIDGQGGRSFLADPRTDPPTSRESACSFHVIKGWSEEADKGWTPEESHTIKACGRAFAGMSHMTVAVATKNIEDIINSNHCGRNKDKQLRLMRKLAEHELMEPQLYGVLSNKDSDRHSRTESANSSALRSGGSGTLGKGQDLCSAVYHTVSALMKQDATYKRVQAGVTPAHAYASRDCHGGPGAAKEARAQSDGAQGELASPLPRVTPSEKSHGVGSCGRSAIPSPGGKRKPGTHSASVAASEKGGVRADRFGKLRQKVCSSTDKQTEEFAKARSAVQGGHMEIAEVGYNTDRTERSFSVGTGGDNYVVTLCRFRLCHCSCVTHAHALHTVSASISGPICL